MSQSKVNSFFLQRKGIRDSHPSKRRKLDGSSNNVEIDLGTHVQGKETQPSATFRGLQQSPVVENDSAGQSISKQMQSGDNCETKKAIRSGSSLLGRRPSSRCKARAGGSSTSSRSSSRLCKDKNSLDSGQQKLTNFIFSLPVGKIGTLASVESSVSEAQAPEKDIPQDQNEINKDSASMECMEEVTSVMDDHRHHAFQTISNEGMSTPRKKMITVEETLSRGPMSRRRKTASRKIKTEDTGSQKHNEDIRKKLDLGLDVTPSPSSSVALEISDSTKHKNEQKKVCAKSDLLKVVKEISATHEAISPLARTPEQNSPTSASILKSTSPKLHDLSEKLQVLTKMNGKALKNRLKQKGLLADCKQKLGDLAKTVTENKTHASSSSDVSNVELSKDEQKEKDLPAYQRFDYLTKEGPPALSLPYTYRLLESAFQAMDTVVCMLHNRSEICTFSKLKSAVQLQTRKNFEQKTAGQIKTVIPDAYHFRQEKNLPAYGPKTGGYQLTIEANLKDKDPATTFTKDGKPSFSLKLVQKRKEYFRHRLLQFVKQHHKRFLESLSPPLNIPDSKLSRWHPKFHLDEVPAISPSDLPQSPDVKVHSAKDVLDMMQKGKINPRVEQALQKVVTETNLSNSNEKENSNSKLSKNEPHPSSSPSTSKETMSSLKGIPPALLAKIRAKEALKMEEALTRDPSEDRKTVLMSRLPEIIRILRSFFVTEKKMALPLATVFKKLGDSCKTGMAISDVEKHINLLKELAPEFVSVVQIQKGKYLKLDKNVDVNAVSSRITNLVKSRR